MNSSSISVNAIIAAVFFIIFIILNAVISLFGAVVFIINTLIAIVLFLVCFAFIKRSTSNPYNAKTKAAASAILKKIKLSDTIFIMGHKFSDFDSIGAAAGIWSICTQAKKKNVYIVVDKHQSSAVPLIKHLEDSDLSDAFISPEKARSIVTENSFLIIVDTNSLDFIESAELYEMTQHVCIIDHHHLSSNKIQGTSIFFHELSASSACEMVTELIRYIGGNTLNKTEAEGLFAGIMLDTKNFSLKSSLQTFEAALYLKRKGADNSKIKKMFAVPLSVHKIKSKIIENANIIENCAVARLSELESNARVACAQAADELVDIENVRASFVIFSCDNEVNISARSQGDVDVRIIMEQMGGGGHQTMAAAQIPEMNFEQVEEKLIKIIKKELMKSKGE